MTTFIGPPYALYSTLQVDNMASAHAIKKAYQELALRFHPDKNGGDDTVFKDVQAAYDVLSNVNRKREYDDYCSMEIAKRVQVEASQYEKERRSPIYKTKSKAGIREKFSDWLKENLYGKFQDVWNESIEKKMDGDLDRVVTATEKLFEKHPFADIEKKLRIAERESRYGRISISSCQRVLAAYKDVLPSTDISFWNEKLKTLSEMRKPKGQKKSGQSSNELALPQSPVELQNLYRHIIESWRRDYERILLQWMLQQIELVKQKLYAEYLSFLNNLRQIKKVMKFFPGFSWDLSMDNLSLQEAQIILKWSEFFRNNSKLQELCDLLGKMNKEASKAEKIKVMGTVQYENTVVDYNSKEEICGVMFGKNIEDALL